MRVGGIGNDPVIDDSSPSTSRDDDTSSRIRDRISRRRDDDPATSGIGSTTEERERSSGSSSTTSEPSPEPRVEQTRIAVENMAGGPIAASERRSDRIDEVRRGIEGISGGPIAASERRSEQIEQTRVALDDMSGGPIAAGERRREDSFDPDAQDAATVATGVGTAVQQVGDSAVGRTLGSGVDALFGDPDNPDHDGYATGLDDRLAGGDEWWRENVVERIESGDPSAADPQSFGLARPFGVTGEDVQDIGATTAQFSNVPGLGRDVLTATEAAGRGGQFAAEYGPDAVQFAGEAAAAGARAAPAATRTAAEFAAENPREVGVGATALIATGGLGAAGFRGGRFAAGRTADAVEDISPGGRPDMPSPRAIADRSPNVSIRRDPTTGPLDVDPMLQQQIRDITEDLTSAPGAAARQAGDSATAPAGERLTDIFGTAGRRTDQAPLSSRTDLSDSFQLGTSRLTQPAGDSVSDIFGTAGRPGPPRVQTGDSAFRTGFDRATQPAGDSVSDVFGTAGAPGMAGSTPFGSAARRGFDWATEPAGATPSDIFGTARAAGEPGAAGRTPFASSGQGGFDWTPSTTFGSTARRGFDRATQPAGDSVSDVFGTAGAPGMAGSTPFGSAARRGFDWATEPAGGTPSDIFGTAPATRETSILDTTLRVGPIRPRRSRTTLDVDDIDLELGPMPEGAAAGARRRGSDDTLDLDADIESGAGGGQATVTRTRRSADDDTTGIGTDTSRRDTPGMGGGLFGGAGAAGVLGSDTEEVFFDDPAETTGVGELEPTAFDAADTDGILGDGTGIGTDDTVGDGLGTGTVGAQTTTPTVTGQPTATGVATSTGLLGEVTTGQTTTQTTTQTTRTPTRPPPRTPIWEPDGGPSEDPEDWGVETDDDLIGSGILSADDLDWDSNAAFVDESRL